MKFKLILWTATAAWMLAAPPVSFSQQLAWNGYGTGEYAPAGQAPDLLPNAGHVAGPPNTILYNPYPAEDTRCPDGSCGCCTKCRRPWDLWVNSELLMWWGKGTYLPPLVTASPDGTARAEAGVLPDADVLFGEEYAGKDVQFGGRFTFGMWLDDEQNVTVAGRFYGTGGDRNVFNKESGGGTILARPFVNALLGDEDALLIAFPDVAAGSVRASLTNNNFMGAEAYIEMMMERDQNRRVDVLAGYQFMRLDDRLFIASNSRITEFGGLLPFGTEIDVFDRFGTQNEFHGGQVGVRGRMARGSWSLDALSKLAVGTSRQQVAINGGTAITLPPGFENELGGGLLAQDSNSGIFERNRIIAIPEFTLNLKYHVNPNLSFHLGYTIIWWSDVVTSGDVIDRRVNLSQLSGPLAGPERPRFAFEDSSYWMQGMNFGMNWDF